MTSRVCFRSWSHHVGDNTGKWNSKSEVGTSLYLCLCVSTPTPSIVTRLIFAVLLGSALDSARRRQARYHPYYCRENEGSFGYLSVHCAMEVDIDQTEGAFPSHLFKLHVTASSLTNLYTRVARLMPIAMRSAFIDSPLPLSSQ